MEDRPDGPPTPPGVPNRNSDMNDHNNKNYDQIYKNFDKNHNGVLEDDEKDALKKAGIPLPGEGPATGRSSNAEEIQAVSSGITEANLPGKIKEAQAALKKLAANPSGATPEQLTILRGRAFGFNLRDESVAVWEAVARAGDVGRTGPPGYQCSTLTKKGFVFALFGAPSNGQPGKSPDDATMLHAKGYTIADRATDADMAELAKRAHGDHKLFYANPSTTELAALGDEKLAALAKVTDIFNIQACKWWYEDPSPDHAAFLADVEKYSAAIRKANPACKIFIDVGRGGDTTNQGNLATNWVKLLTTIDAKDPKCYDGVYIAAPAQTVGQPSIGMSQIMQMLAWMRP
ncbi:MAG TPA: hypothetical protein VL860_01550 [Planctomycetota bacterium]|nr:hypothetical protein [Planctomycetota bacterium]